MALVLGNLTQYVVCQGILKKSDTFPIKNDITSSKENVEVNSTTDCKKSQQPRMFYKRRRRRPYVDTDSNLSPDMTTFGTASIQEFSEVVDPAGCLWAHHCCAAWSTGVCQTDSYDLKNVDRAVIKALTKVSDN